MMRPATIKLFERAIEDACSQSGMLAGLPKIKFDASQAQTILRYIELLEERNKRLETLVEVQTDAIDDARAYLLAQMENPFSEPRELIDILDDALDLEEIIASEKSD